MNKFLVVFFLLFLPLIAYSQNNKAKIGVINFTAVAALHPYMANFDAAEGKFRSDSVRNGNDIYLRRKELNSLLKEKNKLNELREKLQSNYELSVVNAEKSYQNKIKNIIATATLKTEKEAYRQNILKIEEDYKKGINEINRQFSKIEVNIVKLEDFVQSPNYLTFEETEAKLNNIISEIKQIIDKIALKKELICVFDYSYYNRADDLKKNKISGIWFDYKEVINANYDCPNEEKKDEAKLAFYDEITNKARVWANSGVDIFNSDAMPKFIVSGGVDISGEVLKYIFKEHNINKDVTNAIIKAIK